MLYSGDVVEDWLQNNEIMKNVSWGKKREEHEAEYNSQANTSPLPVPEAKGRKNSAPANVNPTRQTIQIYL